MKPKILVVLGPTATGKSELATTLAKQFNGEVVSADSRQIYRGLDIGTGKVPKDKQFGIYTKHKTQDATYFHRGIRHHLIDFADPTKSFSVAQYKHLADKAIHTIYRMGKLPIVEGGTGQYIQAIVDNVTPPEVKPSRSLRSKLQKQSPKELLDELKKLDQKRAETVDQENPRRLIRAIEIATVLGAVPPLGSPTSKYNALQIGLTVEDQKLKEQITKRVRQRLQDGWVAEVFGLIQDGVPWHRIEEFGLGYRCIAEHLQNKLSAVALEDCIITAERRYAKRQVRWFKRDKRIHWFSPDKIGEIETLAMQFFST